MIILHFLYRLFIILIGMSILIGIPYLFGWGWLFLSWIPAIFAILYLDDLSPTI